MRALPVGLAAAVSLTFSPAHAQEVSPAYWGVHGATSSVGLPAGMEFGAWASTPVPFFARTWIAGGQGLFGLELGGILLDRVTLGASANVFRTKITFDTPGPGEQTTDTLAGLGGHLGFLALRDTKNVVYLGLAVERSGIIGSPIPAGPTARISVVGMHRFGDPAGYGVGVYGGAGYLFGDVGEVAKGNRGGHGNVLLHLGLSFSFDFSNGT